MAERLSARDALVSFAAGEPLRAAVFLTYSFDRPWFEEAIVRDLLERSAQNMLVLYDVNAVAREGLSLAYWKAHAYGSRVFHPKLALLVTEDRARAVISSANLTRGSFERQRELGHVFDFGPSALADHSLFTALAEYLDSGVTKAVIRGSDVAGVLAEAAGALHEVVKKYKAPLVASRHTLLHNYAEPIWTQVLKRMPHRVLRRAVIVSPFFEPDRIHPEDPALEPEDTSIFAKMFDDFEFEALKDEAPVRVFFRQSESHTELPLRRLAEFGKKITFFAQDEREQRLHAKLLLLEGGEGPGREPFLLALHGSPNFTTSGLVSVPPHGNSELAVLTTLPAKRKSLEQSIHVLDLGRGFFQVEDFSALLQIEPSDRPRPPFEGIADATYWVAEKSMKVWLLRATPAGARVRILIQRDGSWVVIGEADASSVTDVVIPVTGMADRDGETNLLKLHATTLRINIVGADGKVLTSGLTPVNVDVPEEFCGVTLINSALLTLDERIAQAGLGMPHSYREREKWVESRNPKKVANPGPGVVAYQADLDQFYHNVHQGLRGFLAPSNANPGSEFSTRRSLDQLTRWAVEAATSDREMTRECRLFVVERLLHGARVVLDGGSPTLKDRVAGIAADLCLSDQLSEIIRWLDRIDEPVLVVYAARSRTYAGPQESPHFSRDSYWPIFIANDGIGQSRLSEARP